MYIDETDPRKGAEVRQGFVPALLRVEVSTDLMMSGDELLVTAWWQNAGQKPATTRGICFLDLEFGYQRIMEHQQKTHRITWDPYPPMHQWQPGDIWATTGRWRNPGIWGGTYHLYLGLCDDERVPFTLIGKDGVPTRRILIGDIESGWGSGRPALERTRRPWTVEFNRPAPVNNRRADPADDSRIDDSPITISDGIAVRLSSMRPMVFGMSESGHRNHDETGPPWMTVRPDMTLPEVRFRDRKSDRLIYSCQQDVCVEYSRTALTGNRASYTGVAHCSGEKMAEWTLHFAVHDRKLEITLDQISEEDGYELIEVRLPALASASGSDACMVDFFMGGRLIPVAKSPPMGVEHVYDVRNAAAVFTPQGTAVVECTNLDSKLYQSIQQTADTKMAVVGIGLIARLRAYGCLESVPVRGPKSVTVQLLDDSFGPPSWQAAARALRVGVHGLTPDIYKRALVRKYMLPTGPALDRRRQANRSGGRTFRSVLDMIRKVHNLTDGVPQVVYMVGFQCEGHDTGYPFVFEVNQLAGTYEDLIECISEARRYNTVLSMHDNYDDAYKGPYFDPDIIAMDERGQMLKGWIWTSGLSYIISPAKYVKSGRMKDRVKKTVEMYRIHTSYHLDVLTSEARRPDFDPAWLVDSDSALQCKHAIVNEFNKYGIDITSEVLCHAFVGKVGFAYHTRGSGHSDQSLIPGDRPIPLTQFIYHGAMQYMASCQNEIEMLRCIATGALANWDEGSDDIAKQLAAFYIVTLPLGLLYRRDMKDYTEEGSVVHVSYCGDTHIDIDMANEEYTIVVDGRIVGRNWTTFAPGFREGSYLAYSLRGGRFCYPAPEGWHDGMMVQATTLTAEGEGQALECVIADGCIVMNAPAGVPVRVVPS
ncbi:MAG: hypothetical protein GXX08_00325 [Firmicutes bacterium]|nr:hypothetical protein [Bacillota bacterium]